MRSFFVIHFSAAGVCGKIHIHICIATLHMRSKYKQSLLILLFSSFFAISLVAIPAIHAASVEDAVLEDRESSELTAGVLDAFRGITDAIVAPFRAVAQAIIAYRDGDSSPTPPVRRIVENEVDVLVYQDSTTGEAQSIFTNTVTEDYTQVSPAPAPRSAYDSFKREDSGSSESSDSPWAFLFKRNQEPQQTDPTPPARTTASANQPQIQYQPRVSFAPSASQYITTSGFNPELFNTTQTNPNPQQVSRSTNPAFNRISRNQPSQSGQKFDAPKISDFHGVLSSNAETFTITSDLNNSIQFVSASIDPLNVPVGATQTLSLSLFSENEVAKVSAISEMDTQLFELKLDNVSGGDGALVFQNAWDVFDTHSRTYRTTFRVEDITGRVQTITLAWDDICRGITQGQSSVLQTDCTQSRLTGIDGGQLTVPRGSTMVLKKGADFVYNPGLPLKINGYVALSSSGVPASLRKGYLFYPDSDGDRWAQNFVGRFGASTTLAGHTRAKDMRSHTTTDCNDSASSVSNDCAVYAEASYYSESSYSPPDDDEDDTETIPAQPAYESSYESTYEPIQPSYESSYESGYTPTQPSYESGYAPIQPSYESSYESSYEPVQQSNESLYESGYEPEAPAQTSYQGGYQTEYLPVESSYEPVEEETYECNPAVEVCFTEF